MTYSNVNDWTPEEWQEAVEDNQEESQELDDYDHDHGIERSDTSSDRPQD